jgi:hypothetical protein
MAFINWGEESEEQKAIRRKMEDQMIFEQMMSAAAAAAAAAAGSGGRGISLPKYCGGEKAISPQNNYFDLQYLISDRYRMTDEDFDTYDRLVEDDLGVEFRAARDLYLKKQSENAVARELGKISNIVELPPLPESTKFYSNVLTDSQHTQWLPVTEYESWTEVKVTGFSPADKMPGVKYFNYLTEVASPANLPTSGNPGEIVHVMSDGTFYSWDPDAGEFTSNFFETYVADVVSVQRDNSGDAAKYKNQLSNSITSFLYANKYILDYKIKKSL